MVDIRLKRAYEPAEPTDGQRILVDRLWPRGLSREAARLDGWEKDLTPTTDLRRAYHGGRMSFDEFAAAYRAELTGRDSARQAAGRLADALTKQPVTLLYAARNTQQNHALVLRDWLYEQMNHTRAGA